MDPLHVSFLNSCVVFLLAVYSCSLLIPLLINRFNVVVVNGHDDIEMWTIGPANYIARAIRGHQIGTRRGFHIERRSQGKIRRIQFKLLKRLLNLRYSDFIHNYRTLNVTVL